ncbi:MAG: adenylosuccinate synthase [Thermoplasmatota archaeon]
MVAEVVVGAQWGDEGKGKVVDYLAERADYVVRFNGGDNAGHTIRAGGLELRLHILPSGVLRPGAAVVIANGVAVNPVRLVRELEELRRLGVGEPRLFISERAHVILPYHIELDRVGEEMRGGMRVGTTGRGIGPAFADKASRLGVTMGDLIDARSLGEKLRLALAAKRAALRAGGAGEISLPEIERLCFSAGRRLRRHICDTSALLNRALREGKRVLFEGAQGTLLDPDHGTYPYTTSSSAVAGAASVGAGIGPRLINRVVGVVKAYTTRVGLGPFPTELGGVVGEHLLKRGGEYGTTTGRARRCGWLDLVALRHARDVNGLDALAITKLDVLGGLRRVRVATAYRYRGRRLEGYPASTRILSRVKPDYRVLEGWPALEPSEWAALASGGLKALPCAARDYLDFLSSALETPLELVSLGPSREATIDLRGGAGCPR